MGEKIHYNVRMHGNKVISKQRDRDHRATRLQRNYLQEASHDRFSAQRIITIAITQAKI